MRKVKSGAEGASLSQLKIKTALKQALKQRGHTYKDVAGVWDCSEPTVKRQLGPEELPLTRLLILLDWLGLSLAELHKLAESETLENAKYTARQHEFLVKNPRHFAFLMKLYDSGMSPAAIGRRYGIDAAEIEKILIQLEKFDLIRVGLRGQIRPWYPRPPTLDGALGAAHMREVIDSLAQYFKLRIAAAIARRDPKMNEKGGLMASVFEITPKTYNEYLEKFGRLSRDMESAANVDQNLHPKTQLKSCVMMQGFFLDELETPELALVSDVFGAALKPPPQSGSF